MHKNQVSVRLLTAAGESFHPNDEVTVTRTGMDTFLVEDGAVHNVEESTTVVTIFADAPPGTKRPVITYQISPTDWQRCLQIETKDNRDHKSPDLEQGLGGRWE